MSDEDPGGNTDSEDHGAAEDPTVTTVRSNWLESGRPSVAVVEAVADATGRDPFDVAPLYEYVDGDALDALLTSVPEGVRRDLRVSFQFAGADVVVEGTGRVTVSVARNGRE